MIVLYPPTVNWNLLFQRPNHILKVIAAQGHTCYFMNHRPFIDGEYHNKDMEEVEKNLFIIPYGKQLRLTPDVIYYSYPLHYDFVKSIKSKYTIFDVIDAPVDEFEPWKDNWEKCIKDADLVMASAKKLFDEAQEYNDNVIHVPNGVDYKHFQTKRRNPYRKLKVDGFKRKNPVVGFSGAIATWIDIELLYKSCWEYPDYNFVILGLEYNLKLNKTPDNLFFLGHKPYEELSGWINYMDVCTLPFIPHTPVADACNPLKFWEYLASGNPVISTALPETNFNGVYWCESREDYIKSIGLAMDEKKKGNKGKVERQVLANRHSWINNCKPLLERLNVWSNQ